MQNVKSISLINKTNRILHMCHCAVSALSCKFSSGRRWHYFSNNCFQIPSDVLPFHISSGRPPLCLWPLRSISLLMQGSVQRDVGQEQPSGRSVGYARSMRCSSYNIKKARLYIDAWVCMQRVKKMKLVRLWISQRSKTLRALFLYRHRHKNRALSSAVTLGDTFPCWSENKLWFIQTHKCSCFSNHTLMHPIRAQCMFTGILRSPTLFPEAPSTQRWGHFHHFEIKKFLFLQTQMQHLQPFINAPLWWGLLY